MRNVKNKIEFSKKELILIKQSRADVFGALTRMRELDFSREAGVAGIQAIMLLGVIDDLLASPVGTASKQ